MIELTLPATPEGTAASREVMDALDTAQIEYDAYEEKDGSISFDFGDSDQDAVLDVMRGLGIDVAQQKEDDPQSGDPMYRTESLIEAVRRGKDAGKLLDECATCGCMEADYSKPPNKKGDTVTMNVVTPQGKPVGQAHAKFITEPGWSPNSKAHIAKVKILSSNIEGGLPVGYEATAEWHLGSKKSDDWVIRWWGK